MRIMPATLLDIEQVFRVGTIQTPNLGQQLRYEYRVCCVLGILVCCVQQVFKGSVYRRTGYLGTRVPGYPGHRYPRVADLDRSGSGPGRAGYPAPGTRFSPNRGTILLQVQPMYLRGWQSFQPGQICLGKAGAVAFFDDASAPAPNDPMWHPRGPHGQCRQPCHSCCQ